MHNALKYRVINLIVLIFAFGISVTNAQEHVQLDTLSTQSDTIRVEPETVTEDSIGEPKKTGFFQKIINYFDDSNKEKPEKKFDISFIGGPHYASDTKFGVGVVGAGAYRMKGCSRDMQPSNVSIFGDVSTVGFYMLGIGGHNLFPEDRYRLNYKMYFYSFPTYYWGVGYDLNNDDANKTKMNRIQSKVSVEFVGKLTKNLFFGPTLSWDFIKGSKIEENMHLFQGQDLVLRNYGAGLVLEYDSRDFITNAAKGFYMKVNQMFYPKFLWNKYAFSSTEIMASTYKGVWKGGILAIQVAGSFKYGNPSWAMMSKLGDSNSMRGYYEGRYRDKNMVMGQIELRQHIWRRNGIVVWLGTGSVFHNADTFKHFLPNYGIGYRWEFKKRMNVRLDFGLGKSGQNGFIFNINEAF